MNFVWYVFQALVREDAFLDGAINDETFLCTWIFLVKNMVSQGKEDGFALNDFRFLDDVRVVPDDHICSLVYQPAGSFPLIFVWPFK